MYLIRLDDASDYMDVERWNRMEQLLNAANVKPLVGIIPNNQDPLFVDNYPKSPAFWEKARKWQTDGWRIALHGYEHVYTTNCGGMNPVHNHSEYAGLSLDSQREKIRLGLEVLKAKGLNPDVFFAPSHTFDENTLNALLLESDIRIISDTVANDTYCYKGFTFIPQQSGRVRELPFKLSTICLHPNTTTDEDFLQIEAFLHSHTGQFLDPNSIKETSRKKGLFDYIAERLYFLKRWLSRQK